jgi:hypothetical protein
LLEREALKVAQGPRSKMITFMTFKFIQCIM